MSSLIPFTDTQDQDKTLLDSTISLLYFLVYYFLFDLLFWDQKAGRLENVISDFMAKEVFEDLYLTWAWALESRIWFKSLPRLKIGLNYVDVTSHNELMKSFEVILGHSWSNFYSRKRSWESHIRCQQPQNIRICEILKLNQVWGMCFR